MTAQLERLSWALRPKPGGLRAALGSPSKQYDIVHGRLPEAVLGPTSMQLLDSMEGRTMLNPKLYGMQSQNPCLEVHG